MSDRVEVEVKANNVKIVQSELTERILLALDVVGSDIEDIAAHNAPYDTGYLSESITHAVDDSEKAVYVGTNVEYARYQELGTVNMEAANGGRGYLYPAVSDNIERIKAMFRHIVGG